MEFSTWKNRAEVQKFIYGEVVTEVDKAARNSGQRSRG